MTRQGRTTAKRRIRTIRRLAGLWTNIISKIEDLQYASSEESIPVGWGSKLSIKFSALESHILLLETGSIHSRNHIDCAVRSCILVQKEQQNG